MAKAEHLDDNGREILRLRKERVCNEVETEDQMKLISIRDAEPKEMISRQEMEIVNQLEVVKSLESKSTNLEDELPQTRIVM